MMIDALSLIAENSHRKKEKPIERISKTDKEMSKKKKIEGSPADREAKRKQAWSSGYGRRFAAPSQLSNYKFCSAFSFICKEMNFICKI